MKHNSYRNPRPALTITCVSSRQAGNCYSISEFEVTSTRKLAKETLTSLFDLGMLGSGQSFSILSESAGEDSVPCMTEIDGVAQPGPAVNPYSGVPYEPMKQPFYTYRTQCACDSGD